MKRASVIVIFSAFLCFSFTQASPVLSAQPATYIEVPLQAINENKPVQLQGLISSATFDLNIPKTYKPLEGSWLNLIVQASPLLDTDRSSLTVVMNDLQVTSIHIAQFMAGPLQVKLPLTMVKPGKNTITFTGTLYLGYDKESDCTNWNDPARWLNLAAASLVHLALEPVSASYDLTDFPDTFANPLENYLTTAGAGAQFVILPDVPTSDDLTNLAAVAYTIGSRTTSLQEWRPTIIPESKFDRGLAAGHHLIFINTFPPELVGLEPSGKDFVALQSSPWDPGKAALVIADRDRKDGFSPAHVFSNPVQQVILNGNIAYLDPPDSLPALPAFKNTYTFKELGYLDRTVRGIGDGNLTYRFFIPYDVVPMTASLNLVITHAPDLNIGTSTITIYVNGFSVAGIIPSARSADLTPIQVTIPTTRFRPGVNYVRFAFNLQGAFTSCERVPDAVWATVLNQTSLNTEFRKEKPVPSLNHFPMPFSDNPVGLFVLPDQPTPNMLNHMSELVFHFGRFAMITEQPPLVQQASEFSPEATTSPYIILVGLPGQNSAIRAINPYLPQPFTPDGLALMKGYGVFVPTAEQPADLGLLQNLNSPWKDGGELLVITGLGEQGLEWIWDILQDPAQWAQFSGNLMVVGSQQRIVAASQVESGPPEYYTTEDVSRIPLVGKLLQGISPDNLVPATVSMISALVLMLVLLFVVRYSRRV